MSAHRGTLGTLAAQLHSLSPLAVLGRGYSIVWDAEGQRLVRSAEDVAVGDAVLIRLGEGELRATVLSKETP